LIRARGKTKWKNAKQQVARTSAFEVRGSEWSHGDEKVSIAKKGARDTRHGARVQRAERDHQIKAADLKSGGPRYLLLLKQAEMQL